MTAPTLTIASYNLQKCVGLDLRRRPGRSLRVINALAADIVVLQEADKRLPPRPAALPHQMAITQGWQVVDFGEPGGSLGWHGNAMLLHPDLQVVETQHIDLPGLEPRGAIRAVLDTALGRVQVFGAHLGLIRRFRLLQLAAIGRIYAQLPPLPTVLAGDLNEWGATSALDTALPGLRFLTPPPSFPAPRPVARLDRFALSSDLVALDIGHHRARPAQIASDHLPVWARLARNGPVTR